MKKSCLIVLVFFLTTLLNSSNIDKKRVLYVNSYHSGLAWSDGIAEAIKANFPESQIDLKIFEMDTKRNQTEEFKKKIALKAKQEIDKFKPHLVIISDDNAAKYLLVPFFYNSNIPFIFCGINWDASEYGFPSRNVTGMLEVQLIPQLVEVLKEYSSGNKIGYLKGDSLSSRKEVEFFEKALHVKIDKRFVKSMNDWKKEYLDLQESVDIILFGNGSAVPSWDDSLANIQTFIYKNTKRPSASWSKDMSKLSLLTYATKPEEQGKWAAKTALKVLNGEDIASIPIVKNHEAEMYINTVLMKKLKIIFPYELIDQAVLVK